MRVHFILISLLKHRVGLSLFRFREINDLVLGLKTPVKDVTP